MDYELFGPIPIEHFRLSTCSLRIIHYKKNSENCLIECADNAAFYLPVYIVRKFIDLTSKHKL